MKTGTPVLSPVNKANNELISTNAETYHTSRWELIGEQPVNIPNAQVVHKVLTELQTGHSPEFSRQVEEYLTATEGNDAHLIQAWSRIGHEDWKRQPSASLSAAARTTMTPLGIACLVAYARGYEDEDQAHKVAEAKQKADQSRAEKTEVKTQPTASGRPSLKQELRNHPKRPTASSSRKCPDQGRQRKTPKHPA
jgi:hypothetical protein